METFYFEKKLVPLSNLREPSGGHACTLSRSQHQPTKQNVSQALWGDQGVTNKLGAVYAWVLLDELVDVPMLHPLGDHRKPAFTYRYSEQW